MIQPMIGANSTVAKYCAELKIADAVPRSAVGNQPPRSGRWPGRTALPPSRQEAQREQDVDAPCATPKKPTQPCSKVKSDQPKMLRK